MFDCRENFYRDLNKLLEEDDADKSVIAYTISVCHADSEKKLFLTTIGGGLKSANRIAVAKLIDTVNEQEDE